MKIKNVMIGAGEPIKGVGGCASTMLDGRILIYDNGRKEFIESNGLTMQKVHETLRNGLHTK